MHIKLQKTDTISSAVAENVSYVASLGFEQEGSPQMIEDTHNHITSSELIHLAYDKRRLAGFSLYRSSLWQ